MYIVLLFSGLWRDDCKESDEPGDVEAGITLALVCSRMLTYAHVCWRMLTTARRATRQEMLRQVSPLLSYAHVCSCMLTQLTYAHVCSRMLTYADVC
jgi:hypothetical protein